MWRRGEVACSVYMRALPCCPRTFRCENTTLGSAPAQDVNLLRASTNAQVSPEHMRSMPACSSAMYTLACGQRWQREASYLQFFAGGRKLMLNTQHLHVCRVHGLQLQVRPRKLINQKISHAHHAIALLLGERHAAAKRLSPHAVAPSCPPNRP